jgi:cobalamin-dependent methionine synthase I
LLAGLPGEHHDIGLLLFALAAIEVGYRVLPFGPDMPLEHLAKIARSKHCTAIVLSGAVEPPGEVLNDDLPGLVTATSLPVFVGGLSSVYGCDAITKAGAEPLGQDIDHGLQRLKEVLA